MTTTKVKNGELVSISTTEVDLQPDDTLYASVIIVKCSPVSGTIYFGVGKAGGQRIDAIHDGMQPGAFTAKFLRARRLVPDLGILQLAGYLFQPLALGSVVKGTSAATRHAHECRRSAQGWDWSRSWQ